MNAEIFIRRLKELAPSVEDFKNYNVSENYIKDHISRYDCKPRYNTYFNIITSDEILQLLQAYDCSKVGIGNLSFVNEVIEAEDYYQIGNVELDILVLNKITLEIEVRDHDSLDYVIWPCASKSDLFLEALLACAVFLRSLLSNPLLEQDKDYMLDVVNLCSEKVGGEKYLDFYKMLLGYFD